MNVNVKIRGAKRILLRDCKTECRMVNIWFDLKAVEHRVKRYFCILKLKDHLELLDKERLMQLD